MAQRKRSGEDFAQEIQSHLELETEALKRQGMSEDAALQKAKSEFGSVSVARERFYLRGRAEWLENLVYGHRGSCHGTGHWRQRGDLCVCGCGTHQAVAV